MSPPCLLVILLHAKYRSRILRRFGVGFQSFLGNVPPGSPRIWVHALSVGEVASVKPLIKKIRKKQPGAVILFSCTTSSGEEYARNALADEVDSVFTYPLDLVWLTRRYIRGISPDLFILIETDFWPNFLYSLKKSGIPALLVNGRVSLRSHRLYRYVRPLYLPMLKVFDYLAVQRKVDRDNMISIGVPVERIMLPGNLKYDGLDFTGRKPGKGLSRADFLIPDDALLMVSGSTHPGEEEAILRFMQKMVLRYPELRLIIAPRKIERGHEIRAMAREYGFNCRFRSESPLSDVKVVILDTLGELAEVYGIADLAFVGGSLVPTGGHNPLEPAALGKPVLFGPYMEDFHDIATEMLDEGAAVQANSPEDLIRCGGELLDNPSLRQDLGKKAEEFVRERRGAVDNYYRIIERLLQTS